MVHVAFGVAHTLLATGSAPADWAYGAAASAVFVAVIVIPAAVLNARDHRRYQAEEGSRAPASPTAGARPAKSP